MAAQLHFGRDEQGYNAYAPYPSINKWNANLTANVETNIFVPSTSSIWIVSFRYSPADVWVDVSGNPAAIPVSGTLSSSTSELNPASLTLLARTKISVITSQTNAHVSIVMWPAGI